MAAGFGAQQPVGPAVPSNLCDDLSWAQSRRRVLPCVIPVRLSVRPVPVRLACLAGRLGRGGPADPTNPTVFGRTHNWSTGDHREGHVWQFGSSGASRHRRGSTGWDVTRAVSSHPVSPSASQTTVATSVGVSEHPQLTSEFLPLVEYLELALDAIAVACAAKLGVGNEMEGFVRSPAWALLQACSGLWRHRRNEGLLGLCRASLCRGTGCNLWRVIGGVGSDWST